MSRLCAEKSEKESLFLLPAFFGEENTIEDAREQDHCSFLVNDFGGLSEKREKKGCKRKRCVRKEKELRKVRPRIEKSSAIGHHFLR